MTGLPTRSGWPTPSPTAPAFRRSGSMPSHADKSHALTDGLAEAGEPVFDHSGKYLYFLASTDAGPVKNWFDQSITDMQRDLLDLPGHAREGDGQPALEGKRRRGGRRSSEQGQRVPKDKPVRRRGERQGQKDKKAQARRSRRS